MKSCNISCTIFKRSLFHEKKKKQKGKEEELRRITINQQYLKRSLCSRYFCFELFLVFKNLLPTFTLLSSEPPILYRKESKLT